MATAELVPTSGSGYTSIDEGSPGNDADYISTSTIPSPLEPAPYTITNVPAEATEITSITINGRGKIDSGLEGGGVTIFLFPDSDMTLGNEIAFVNVHGVGSWGSGNATINGSWTPAEVNAMYAGILMFPPFKGTAYCSVWWADITYSAGPSHSINGTTDYDEINGYTIASGTTLNGVDLFG